MYLIPGFRIKPWPQFQGYLTRRLCDSCKPFTLIWTFLCWRPNNCTEFSVMNEACDPWSRKARRLSGVPSAESIVTTAVGSSTPYFSLKQPSSNLLITLDDIYKASLLKSSTPLLLIDSVGLGKVED